jgi:Predicted transcriptional regulators
MSYTARDTEIGIRLRAIRRAAPQGGKFMSQGEFATALGLSLRAYQNYERGERPISKDLISSVVGVFGISTDWLLFGEGAMFRARTSTTNSEIVQACPGPHEVAA